MLVVIGLGCAVAASPPPLAPGFWDHWGDGKAELDGYRLTTPRYGAPRSGYAVLVFVTETFTGKTAVKSDGGHDDEYPVLKLNEIRHFQTGIYDYDLMTSTFAALDGRHPPGVPVKVSFGSQEWCGNLYDQLLIDGRRVHRTRHSYFDGEADVDDVYRRPEGSWYADSLPIAVRGLLGELATGALSVYPTLADVRLSHGKLEPRPATLSRDAGPHDVTVPAGTFSVVSTTLAVEGGPSTTWDVEAAAPRRIVRWTRSDGEVAELTGSSRRQYWKENAPGGEEHLRELGLDLP
jgi:hypothetical protein